MQSIYYQFAQATSGYGCSAYGQTDSYSSCNPINETNTSAGANGGGNLQTTGVNIVLPLVVSVLLIVAAIALFKKRKA
jgi:hypothetical protein